MISSAVRPLDGTRISERNQRARALPAGGGPAVRGGPAEPGHGLAEQRGRVSTPAADRRFRACGRAAAAAEWFPAHVRNCANNPRKEGRWTLAFWPKATPTQQTRVAYTCSSYRCPSPDCQRAAAHRDFAKIQEAVAGVEDARGWCLLVLTIDKNETLAARASGGGWKDEQEAFRALSRMSRNFLSRLRRWHKREGWPDFKNRWIATVEVQRNGWPHLNLMIHSPGMASWLDAQGPRGQVTHHVTGKKIDSWPLRGQLAEHAIACDWGTVGHAQRARDSEALTGYIVKVAGNFDRQVGEISKLTQAPTNARMKLRRLRAGKGFVRVAEGSDLWTGIMLRRRQECGTIKVEPLMQPDQVKCKPEEQPNYLEGARVAMREELAQAIADRKAGVELLRVEPLERVLLEWGAVLEPRHLTERLGPNDTPARGSGELLPFRKAGPGGGLADLHAPASFGEHGEAQNQEGGSNHHSI